MKRIKGFTLVELLIVIALLGVLAAAVLAAINPLEQANRARDTRMRSDASQLLAAVDRYYVASDHFPWFTAGVDDNDPYGFTSAAALGTLGPGICGTSCTGTNYGLLIGTNELKSEFMNRDFVKATVDTDMLYIGKADAGATGIAVSVYACWVPKSKSERAKATKSITVGSPTMATETPTACATTKTYADLDTSCVVCLPQ
jgi:prepilin-type N-terminal cleavage/methylation domain-containing protein